MIILLIAVPFFAGAVSFLIRNDNFRRGLLLTAACLHTGLTIAVCRMTSMPANNWVFIDAIGKVFLGITSLLFCAAAVYTAGYLRAEGHREKKDIEEGQIFRNTPEAVFSGCLLLFLGSMTVVTVSCHFGLLWIAMEATTLVSAPLIYFHRHHRSLEAVWKYLLICSVGIALALLGNLFLAVAMSLSGHNEVSLVIPELIAKGGKLNVLWLKAAFLFMVVGYGTKMGLAPLHTWLPDAHSEAPSVVSALLSGALLNCAFLGIVRIYQVCVSAGIGDFSREIFLFFGLLSMGIAALFILGQRDYKRMLAYSSIEHMGILALGVGIGGTAAFGSLLHLLNHSLTKAFLFFISGNILAVYRTKEVNNVSGIIRLLPVSGVLWLAGFLAITGFPPFGLFISEITILKGALEKGYTIIAVLYLLLLAIVFIGMALIMPKMVQGQAPDNLTHTRRKEAVFIIFPALVLCGIVFIMGVYIPQTLQSLLMQAAQIMEGR